MMDGCPVSIKKTSDCPVVNMDLPEQTVNLAGKPKYHPAVNNQDGNRGADETEKWTEKLHTAPGAIG